MGNQEELVRAFRFCLRAHEHQVDKSGAPYVLHPVRMALRAANHEERVLCLLHDVLEDRPDLEGLLTEEFGQPVVELLWVLTRQRDEPYKAYIERVACYPAARRVKILDLEDNMAPERLAMLPEGVTVPLQRYALALRRLQQEERERAWRER